MSPTSGKPAGPGNQAEPSRDRADSAGLDRRLSSADADALAGAILARTSGPVCPSVEARLLERADGVLGPLDAQIVAEHLARCAACAAIAEALDVLREELPQMAEADPGPWFTEQVLARTVRAGASARRRPAWILSLGDHGASLLRRPRIALEAAYVGAALLFLLLGSPSALMQSIPARFASFGHETTSAARLPAGGLADGVDRLGNGWPQKLRESPAGLAYGSLEHLVGMAARGGERVATSVEVTARGTAAGAEALLHGDPGAMGRAWERLRGDLRRLWRREPAVKGAIGGAAGPAATAGGGAAAGGGAGRNSEERGEPAEGGMRPQSRAGQVGPSRP
ncbi:MAG: zf-HC2 domain-containing protein [Candidatus Eisenbacteria bacterium]